MCGIAGFIFSKADSYSPEAAARAMADAIRHRGPDDWGVWADPDAGIALSQRRLSIIDLSPAGHQPMVSACGRYVIVFNGEIYNFAELRSALADKGHVPAWRGHSDTEILLEALAALGVEKALKLAAGMFAFALWDRQERTLVLARDRLGEKPLYWGWSRDTLLFGSELPALMRHPDWQGDIDRDALALMMRLNNVPAPRTIYRGICKLRAGTYLVVKPQVRQTQEHVYWCATETAARGRDAPFRGSRDEALAEAERRLKSAIAGQMVADVPLGAFLSGGIDSSTIVALMQELATSPVKTFSIGFHESGFDEAVYARAVAKHLGTEHHELYVSPETARSVIPDLPRIYSEPFADSSQIPTFLVAKMAREHVTVALSGDAGDEIFSGYRRYEFADRRWPQLRRVPSRVRHAAASLVQSFSPETIDRLALGRPHAGNRLHKLARIAHLDAIDDVYDALVSFWPAPHELVIGAGETALPAIAGEFDPVRRMMLRDVLGYLADDILVKVDRAAMAVSLETRVPFLDHRLIEFVATLPISTLRAKGQSKWLLRRMLDKRVPRQLFERPKSGFSVPIAPWLRGPLRDWAEALLDPARIAAEGYLQPAAVRTAWDEVLTGRAPSHEKIWNVLMFQSWLESTTTLGKKPQASHAGAAA